MIKVEKMSYDFPQKDLYNKVSFSIEEGQHCAFIGTNGTGKSTLVNILINPDNYLFTGKLEKPENCTIGYVSQFLSDDVNDDETVFEYISREFVKLQGKINEICDEMANSSELDKLMEEYQTALDAFSAIDGDNYESNIKKQLKLAKLTRLEGLKMSQLSGGEFKLIQIIKEMIVSPKLLIMDEPDVFLDFEHLNSLKDLMNNHKGTMLVITHNRYLLHHCFNKILHLEDTNIQEFDGTYEEYNYSLLRRKIELQEQALADKEEIERNEKMVEQLRNRATMIDSATLGRSLHAKVSQLERLKSRRTKDPFVDIRQPAISFYTDIENDEEQSVLSVNNYNLAFDDLLLENVSFEIKAKDKVAIVGNNGTGKTTLLREIYQAAKLKLSDQEGEADADKENINKTIKTGTNTRVEYLSQIQGEMLNENESVREIFEKLGFEIDNDIREYLQSYSFKEDIINNKISDLSGGEKNLIQLAKLSLENANLLLLDEPTSHLDTYSQIALEKAVSEFNGAVLMVSHDFYTVANCMDYVLFVENNTIRRMSIRKFRKMIYEKYFDKNYLEKEQKKKEAENRVELALKDGNFEKAKKLLEELEAI